MALSYVIYEGDGVEDEYSFTNISLLDDDIVTYASQLRVYVDGVLKTLTTDYTVDVANNKITFVAGSIPLAGTEVKIQRFSKSDGRYITYTNSTNITASILNTDADHLFHLAQEALDLRDNAITLNTDDEYNANNKIITNLAPAVGSSDAVNLGQLNAAVTGGLPATLGNQGYFTKTHTTGDSLVITLPTGMSGLSASDINVFVNGSKKIPTTDYTVSGNTLTLLSTPTNGHVIQVTWAKGTVPATFAVGELDTDMYKDMSVTAAKIDAETATTNHVLRVTNSPLAGNVGFGTIPASVISDFDTQVRTNRLDQMAAPLNSVAMGSQKITGLAVPTAANDAVPKTYLDTNYFQIRTYTVPYTSIAAATTSGTQAKQYTLNHNLTTVHKVHLMIPLQNGTTGTLYLPYTCSIPVNTTLGEMYAGPYLAYYAQASNMTLRVKMAISSGSIAFTVLSSVANTISSAASTGVPAQATTITGHPEGLLSRDWVIQLEGV